MSTLARLVVNVLLDGLDLAAHIAAAVQAWHTEHEWRTAPPDPEETNHERGVPQ